MHPLPPSTSLCGPNHIQPPEGIPSLSVFRPAVPLPFSYYHKQMCKQSLPPQTLLRRRTRFDTFQYSAPDFLLIQDHGADKWSECLMQKLLSEDSAPELHIFLQCQCSNVLPHHPSPLPHPVLQTYRIRLLKTGPCPGCHR